MPWLPSAMPCGWSPTVPPVAWASSCWPWQMPGIGTFGLARPDAVSQHLGIGSLPAFMAQAALAAGEVVQVLCDWEFKTNYHGHVWMLYPQTHHPPSRTQLFIDFMAQHLAPRALPGPVKATARRSEAGPWHCAAVSGGDGLISGGGIEYRLHRRGDGIGVFARAKF